MSSNIQRSQGRGASYKFDRGGMPAEMGPFIGEVKNNIDPAKAGRLQVYIEQFSGNDPADESLWRTVSYIPPFYGVTPGNNSTTTVGSGNYKGNQQSYGMWFTPPDIGVKVICFFVAGDPNQGYYLGCIPDDGANHMIPAIGASKQYVLQNAEQAKLATGANATQLPVVEANFYNTKVDNDPRFFTQPKPVHSYVFAILANQGLLGDNIRGPITSNSQRESPSSVFGISTPGRPIYQGGLDEATIKKKLDAGQIKLADIKVEGRRGGHSIVLDDGDLKGNDNLVRIRTSKGHQITMSDDGDCLYIIHANGQSWIEMGSEGTIDMYASNSVNVRTEGVLNLHSDKDININANGKLNMRGKTVAIESQGAMSLNSAKTLTMVGKLSVGISSTGSVAVKGAVGSWSSTGFLNLKGGIININGTVPATPVPDPAPIQRYKLDDTAFSVASGWVVKPGEFESIVNRAPTHEPYPYHNLGVPVTVDYSDTGVSSDAPPAPQAGEVDTALATVVDIPITDPIDNQTLLSTTPASEAIGNLNTSQVTSLMSQAKTAVNQAADAVSIDKGIGQYGFKPDQLESVGLLKPGTVNQLKTLTPGTPTAADIAQAAELNLTPEQVAVGNKVIQTLASPTVWTGQSGVNNLAGLLTNNNLQGDVQQNLMSTALNGLRSTGYVSGSEPAEKLGSLVQSATKFGVGNTSEWINGVANNQVVQDVSNTIKSAQYAVTFVSSQVAVANKLLGGLTNTGISTSLSTVADTANQTSRTLNGLSTQADQAINQVLGETTSQVTAALSEITGPLRGIGGLGDQVSSLSGLTSLTGLTGSLSGVGTLLSNSLNGVLGSLGLSSLSNLGGLSAIGGLFGGGGGAVPARYAANTVNRKAVDTAINAALGDPKIPPITYST